MILEGERSREKEIKSRIFGKLAKFLHKIHLPSIYLALFTTCGEEEESETDDVLDEDLCGDPDGDKREEEEEEEGEEREEREEDEDEEIEGEEGGEE